MVGLEKDVSEWEIYLMEDMSGRETMERVVKKNKISISDETVDKIIKFKRKIFNDIDDISKY